MAGIINSAPSTTPSITDQINNIYQTKFGRPADDAGLAFWSNAAQQNPSGDLASMIGAGAQTQDKAAAADIAAGGVNTSSTWGSGLNPNDVATQNDTWDAAANKWVAPQATAAAGAPMSTATPAPSTQAASGQSIGTGYTAAQQAPAVSSDITKRVIDPTTETTAGQIQGIINQNSPLMQQAQARALQQANDRGLGNSSLAVGAAQGAVLSAATPIANADAGVYGNAATLNATTQNQFTAQKDATQNQINANNAGAINTASAFGADANNKASLQNASLSTQVAMSNADNATKQILQTVQSNSQLGVAQLSAQTQMALGNLDATTKTSLATLDAQNKQLLQTNTSAANLFNQTITNLTNIASSSTMDAAAKQTATDNQMTLLQQGMTAIGATAGTNPGSIASLNLGQYFTQAAAPAATTEPSDGAYTAPNGQVWTSKDAYDQANGQSSSSGGE